MLNSAMKYKTNYNIEKNDLQDKEEGQKINNIVRLWFVI